METNTDYRSFHPSLYGDELLSDKEKITIWNKLTIYFYSFKRIELRNKYRDKAINMDKSNIG